MSQVYIDIGRDFSRDLGPRYRSFGAHSGEEFRDDILIPVFERNDSVVVGLDSVAGFSSSFLEEAFGGLVREFGLSAVNAKLVFDALETARWIPLIQAWMRDAEQDFRAKVPNKRTK